MRRIRDGPHSPQWHEIATEAVKKLPAVSIENGAKNPAKFGGIRCFVT
jgi:hypothetical protein